MKLRTKLFLPLLGMALLFAAYAHFLWLPSIIKEMDAMEEHGLRAHLRSVAEGLVPLLLEDQLANVYENLDTLREQNPEWVQIQLANRHGHRIYPLNEPPPIDHDAGDIRLFDQHVGFLGPPLARLQVAVDFAPHQARIAALGTNFHIAVLVLLTTFVAVTTLMLETIVRRPIKHLADAADHLADGNYDIPMPRAGDDEVGSLVSHFAAMRNALRAYHQRLIGEIDNHRRTAEALRQEKERATFQATHDPLTGLINRQEFERQLSATLDDARHLGNEHALLYLDLDQFKIVNDTCGHMAGDMLLKQLVVVIEGKVRRHDTLARLGGDEFGVLLRDCDISNALKVADGLREAVEGFRFSWEDKVFTVTVSIGVVGINRDSGNAAQLLSAADSACYVAKDLGRNHIKVFQESDDTLAQRHGEMVWATRLRSAILHDELELYCQPIVPTTEHDLNCHYEVLLRLREPDGSLVLPGAFIPAAERYDMSGQLDRWVVEHTFDFLARLSPELEVQVAINLSGPSLSDLGLLAYIEERLNRGDLHGHSLCLEITESAAVRSFTAAQHFIDRLRGCGCLFALDDFGTGMSSFSYLKSLKVDYLKIDGTFVRNIDHDPVDRAMVKSIHDIARTLGLQTIAEFVESEDILHELKGIGVDYAQGYYIHEPCPLDRLAASLATIT